MTPKSRALLVVPPLLKYSAGPLLGPTLLASAARARGHEATVLDLNIRFIQAHLPQRAAPTPSIVVGDHDKPGALLSDLQRDIFTSLLREALTGVEPIEGADPYLTLTCSHDDIERAVERLAQSAPGTAMKSALEAQPEPHVFGVSVLFSGQVLFGLVASLMARSLWPGVRVVWGGPHVTALQDRIAADARFGRIVDAFVFGYAERTFADLLDATARGEPMPAGCVRAGQRAIVRADDDPTHAPYFQDLDLYGMPRLTLPAQLSRGCSYGRCGFCTYPTIEGAYRPIRGDSIEPIVRLAEDLNATIAMKDSLVLPARLSEMAARIAGRARWSACTKINRGFGPELFKEIARGGCDTLEIGLETIDPDSQKLIEKRQSIDLFLRTLDAAAASGVGLVINYITGFPGTSRQDGERELHWLRKSIEERRPALRAIIEHNDFQLERLSPMAARPAAFGLRVTGEWPWASVLRWDAAEEPPRARRLAMVSQDGSHPVARTGVALKSSSGNR
ncbi:MAG: radical SAM protein [Polyangiaceae bacterium]|nr:radical SAM protein [Polyangiaceae bacterium]